MYYVILTLSGAYHDTAHPAKGAIPSGRRHEFRFDSFLQKVDRILRFRKAVTVLVNCKPDFHADWTAALEGIRRELVSLTAAGNHLVFVAQNWAMQEVYLGSACEERVIHPLGSFRFQGFYHSALYFGKFLRELGFRIHPARRGKFKSAPDRLLRSDMTHADREQYGSYLDSVRQALSGTVVSSLGIPQDELDLLLAGAVLSPDQAKNHGWVTRVSTFQQLVEEQRLNKVRSRSVRTSNMAGRGRRIAVLFLEGVIADGQSRRSLLTGQTIGAESYAPNIRRLRDDRSVAAVVLRINSGGGSATASEDLYEEVRRLAEKKPVAVSFGGVTASGGYWIACAGAKIFAEKTTLTGSIGVFSLSFHLDNLMRRRGIGWSVIRRGQSADRGSLFRSPTQSEEEQTEAEVDRIYGEFLERVARARNKDRQQIDAIAQGRVWSGSDAIDIGLVDRIGGIREAVQELADAVGLRHYRISFHPRVRYGLLERLVYSRFASVDLAAVAESSILSHLADSPAAITREIAMLCGPVMALSPEAMGDTP